MHEARILDSLAKVPPSQWDALHDGRNPFVAHAFLLGLEQHGCLRERWGWRPQHLTLWDGDDLIAAAPAYLKDNSHGEFVFDHAWAHAYARAGLDYFPKWLCAVPYSPVTGPRLLANTPERRGMLVQVMAGLGAGNELSSAHVNFHTPEEDADFDDDWLQRLDVQYHWRNDRGWRGFDDYLAAFDHKHRKNIRQERAKVARAGITFRVADGTQATAEDLSAMHDFYLQTFAEYGNHPAITLEFLQHLARAMPESLVIMLAMRDDAPIAGALCLRGGDTLYGRYWGAMETVPGLHFETCYYQGIEYCLREGLTRFEPGAQGEHKLARGFLPTFVRSRHWIAHPQFRDALRDWCAQEAESIRAYARTLAAHSPFKSSEGGAGGGDASSSPA
ncbi:GNAT family N-acetyltransferase [Lysobacter changpingensis]|uniref:GNAT family N-acetyltransferase n=1 Tax=Lysobacter changpingensis TaxID=2792784 RepID=UPI001A901C62|nr:GNAT family N-acetyltransferase [Lysobacter changpingensis]